MYNTCTDIRYKQAKLEISQLHLKKSSFMSQVSQRKLVCARAVVQSDPTLCDPMDCSLPGSSVGGIFQARILEQVAIFYSRGAS